MTNRLEENGQAAIEAQPAMPPDLEGAIRQLRDEQGRRCMEEINAVLEKYKCRLVATTILRDGRIESSVLIAPVN